MISWVKDIYKTIGRQHITLNYGCILKDTGGRLAYVQYHSWIGIPIRDFLLGARFKVKC